MNLSDQLDLEDYDWLIDRWRFSSPSQLAPQIYILSTFVGKMNLSDEVDLEDYVARPDRISGKKLIINRL